jgi:hypothetical protein
VRPTALAAVVAVLAFTAPVPSDAAPAAATFVLNLQIGCFGCGTYGPAGNTATGTVVGANHLRTGAPVTGQFTVDEPVGPTCVASGSASGVLTVDEDAVPFGWTRVGALTVITTPTGSGTGAFTITSPTGNPCGGPVTARLVAGIEYDSGRDVTLEDVLLLGTDGAALVYGEIVITDAGLGAGPTFQYGGVFGPGTRAHCLRQWDLDGGIVVECAAPRLPIYTCARVHASSRVGPAPEVVRPGDDPLAQIFWGGSLATTATCLQQVHAHATTADATMRNPLTMSTQPGTGPAYALRCEARYSTSSPGAPRPPYRSICRLYAQ